MWTRTLTSDPLVAAAGELVDAFHDLRRQVRAPGVAAGADDPVLLVALARVGADRAAVEGRLEQDRRPVDADALGHLPHRRLRVEHELLVGDEENALAEAL